jgi:predicted DNA-binding protein with PD1-like motif
MKYRIGKPGRIIIVRFDDRDEIIGNLVHIAKKENIMTGVFYIIGGMREGRIVVGPEKDELPPSPVWKELGESHEVVGLGTIFWQEDEPKVHFHGAFGKRDAVSMGCLREKSETFLVIEAIIIEIEGVNAVREIDPVSGIALLNFAD